MGQRLTFFAALFFGLASFAGACIAAPDIDEKTVLQVCEAFSAKDPARMPAIVQPEAAANLFATYARFSEQLQGCLSAVQTNRDGNAVTFRLQNTWYESDWKLGSVDGQSISGISIERFRPVTLAADEPWQDTSPRFVLASHSASAEESARFDRALRQDLHCDKQSSGGCRSKALDSGSDIRRPTGRAKKAANPKGNTTEATRKPVETAETAAPDPASIKKEVQAAASDPYLVEFFYATNRQESDAPLELEGNPPPAGTMDGVLIYSSNGWTAVSGYTGERSPALNVGIVRVRVPEGHHIGNIELPSSVKFWGITLKSYASDPTKHFTIRSIEKTDEAKWVQALASSKKKKALVFVHGFNTKFRDAVFRAAQITWDLQFKGATVLFSWPSRGEIADYLYDKDSALASRGALLHVIDNLHKAGFDEIDLIAHSMGNLVAVDALANSAATQSPTAIAQFIMAAPDVDRDMFIQDIAGVKKVTRGLTLYASKNDKALQLSKRIAGDIPRAGDVPTGGPIVLPGLSTIDVSAIGDEMFGLNHNAFATTRNVLNDLAILLEHGTPPPRLTEIRGYPEPPLAATYFRYLP